jgi:hypothetical protein
MLDVLCTQPGIGAPARRSRAKGVRRATLARVRYYIYYRVSGELLTCLPSGTPVEVDNRVFETMAEPSLSRCIPHTHP